MIIISFIAKKVFGYLDFKIDFNKDINFLVGSNGSGKTTVLKLINALSTPNLKDLLTIPFEEVTLVIEEKDKVVRIAARSEKNLKILSSSLCVEELALPSLYRDDFLIHKPEKIDEEVESILSKYVDHDVVKSITDLPTPIFLGLDRRRESGEKNEDYYREREAWYTINKRAFSTRRLIKGSLGVSLMETEFLVQNSYRRLRELEDRYSSKLRDSILLSAFQYSEVEKSSLTPDVNRWRLLERQREIKQALYKVVAKESKVSNEVDNFFSRLTNLVEQLQGNEDGISIEWLLNKAQIDRMAKIVDIIDEHKSRVDDIFRPIIDFLSAVNSFYCDSGKKLDIDAVGQLFITRPGGGKCTIEGLSSGERQILVIFAQVFFGKRNARSIFLIDEPELSLHLRWQEKFSEIIFTVNPELQFILATHSPEIVGQNKHKSVRCH